MGTYNICFCAAIRKIFILFGLKKVPMVEKVPKATSIHSVFSVCIQTDKPEQTV